MGLGLDFFAWQVAEHGYRWITASQLESDGSRSEEGRFLIGPDDGGATYRRPLIDQPTLFKEFAALTPSEESFKDFADRHGLLGIPRLLAQPGLLQKGEPLSRWREEWSALRDVADVLDAIQAENEDALRQYVQLTETRASLHISRPDGHQAAGRIADREEFRPWLWQFAHEARKPSAQLARLAQGWVQGQINDALMGASIHQEETSVTARVLFDPPRGAFSLHLVPRTLIAAMWFQCARVLSENPQFRQCAHSRCGKWFELSPDAKRTNTKFCGDRCKVAQWRLDNPGWKERQRASRKSTTRTR